MSKKYEITTQVYVIVLRSVEMLRFFGTAIVFDRAWIFDEAKVYGKSRIFGDAKILVMQK